MKKIYLYIILLLLIVLSLYKILNWSNENTIIYEENNLIENNVEINEIDIIDSTNSEIYSSDIYKDYANMKLIDVDFNNLKDINKYVKGWIQVKGTKVNYPYVQYSDNDYYLTHSFENKKSTAGWIFMDYRNNPNEFDDNTIIYGHNRFNKTMFGSLKDTTKNGWFNTSENHIINLSNEKYNSLWKIFSIYRIATTNDYLKTNFNNTAEFNIFIRNALTRSIYNFKTNVTNNDKILTLSTCNGSKEKLVIHAKLLEIQEKENKYE